MTEPEYIYRKGLGWHIAPLYKVLVTEDGYKVKLEHRLPLNGEYYMLQWTDYTHWYRNNQPIMEVFENHVTNYRYKDNLIFSEDQAYQTTIHTATGGTADPVYITIVPVETP